MDEGGNISSRRRRGAGIVTANACTECRKKRSKVCMLQYPTWVQDLTVPSVMVKHHAAGVWPSRLNAFTKFLSVKVKKR